MENVWCFRKISKIKSDKQMIFFAGGRLASNDGKNLYSQDSDTILLSGDGVI